MKKIFTRLLSLFFLIAFGNSANSQNTESLTGSGTWNVPAGVTSITVKCWGGGGGGGGSSTNNSGGSGGGGGAYSSINIAVTNGWSFTYSVGTAGAGGAATAATKGGNGAASTFNGNSYSLTANGGVGGYSNKGTIGSGGTASGGTTNTTGANGVVGGASGGNGGNSPNGGTGGTGGTNAVGGIGNPPGGGGGGGEYGGSSGKKGGNGAAGSITVSYSFSTCPFSESFDGATFAPTYWANTQVSGTGLWKRVTSGTHPVCANHSGAGMTSFNCYNYTTGTEAILVTPPFNTTTGDYMLSFWMYRDNQYSNADLVNIYYNTSPTKTGATLLGTINRYSGASPVATGNTWNQYTYSSLPANSNLYIIFDGVSAYGNDIYLDDINIARAAPAAPGAITSNSPQSCGNSITFSQGSCPSGCTCYWQTTATGTSTANSASTYTTSSTTGVYTMYVRAYNGCTWSTAVSANGIVGASIFSESFEGTNFPPTDWTQYGSASHTSSNSWIRATAFSPAPEGSYCAHINYDDYYVIDCALSTPNVCLTGFTGCLLNFNVYMNGNWLDNIYVEISTNDPGDGSGTWTQLALYTNTGGAWTGWQNKTINISAYSGNVRIRFRSSQPIGSNSNQIDFVNVVGCPNCAAPSGGSFSSVTSSTATVSWTAASPVPTNYDIYYSTISTVPSGSTTPSVTVAGTSPTYNMTNLFANTKYYVWVRSNCGCSSSSAWVGPITFTTSLCSGTVPGDPDPTSALATPSAMCAGLTSILSASVGSDGNALDWYTGSCGGTFMGSGYLPVTPSTTTTYFVKSRISSTGCQSYNCAQVTLTINPIPDPPTGLTTSPVAPVCSGTTTTLQGTPGTNGNRVDWYLACGQNFLGSGNYNVTPTASNLNTLYNYYAMTYNTTTGCQSTSCTKLTVEVDVPVAITMQPVNQIVVSGTGWTVPFFVGVIAGASSYQWQYYNGSSWNNVVNGTPAGAVYTNSSTDNMDVSGITLTGVYSYRCFINGGCGSLSSDQASLTVDASSTTYTTFWAKASGNWSSKLTWSTVGCGGTTAARVPSLAYDLVIICEPYSVTMDLASVSVAQITNRYLLIINSGCTLTIPNGGSFINYPGGVIPEVRIKSGGVVGGSIINNGDYVEEGVTTVGYSANGGDATFINNGTYNIVSNYAHAQMIVGSAASQKGLVTNNGTIINDNTNFVNTTTKYNGIEVKYGTLYNSSTGTIKNAGGFWTLGNGITFYCFGLGASLGSGTITNDGTINSITYTDLINGGTLNNNKTYNNLSYTCVDGNGVFNNGFSSVNGVYNENFETFIGGSFVNYNGANVNIATASNPGNGILMLYSSSAILTNNVGGIITNRGVGSFAGFTLNMPGSKVTNDGTIHDYGNIENNGTFTNNNIFNYYMSKGSIIGNNYFKYGANATLNYLGTIAQTTSSYELPPTNRVNWVTVDNSNAGGVTLDADHTIGTSLSSGVSLTLTNGPLNLNNHTLTVENTSNGAIASTSNGYVVSESENSKLNWKIDTKTGIFTFPFGRKSGSLRLIPFIFNVTSAGNGSGNIAVSTYHSGSNNLPLPQAVYNITGGGALNNCENILDRWWLISQSGYSSNPTANLTFNFEYDTEIGSPNTITETELQAQHWNGSSWDLPVGVHSLHQVYVENIHDFSPWTLVNKKIPLPIELMSFSAKCNDNKVNLNWVTASETNNDYFTIERSKNAQNWEYVNNVIGAGNSNKPTNYSIDDDQPIEGSSFYRLKQTDYDGEFTYSEITPVACESSENLFEMLAIIQGQQNDEIILVFTAPEGEKFDYSVIDNTGKLIQHKSEKAIGGLNEIHIKTIGLNEGIYLITLQNSEKFFGQKVLIK